MPACLRLPERDACVLVRICAAFDGIVRQGDPALETRHAIEQALAQRTLAGALHGRVSSCHAARDERPAEMVAVAFQQLTALAVRSRGIEPRDA